jgi:CRISPR-associated endonuclease/helicase Cas3
VARDLLQPERRLVDLEHARMQATMLPNTALNAASCWQMAPADALLTAVLPQQQPFRFDPLQRVNLELRPDGNDYKLMYLQEKNGNRRGETISITVEMSLHTRISDEQIVGEHISAWGQTDYMQALTDLATELNISLEVCAMRFGTVTLPKNDNGWRFHPVLGFTKAKI